jgi:hypothetical protein
VSETAQLRLTLVPDWLHERGSDPGGTPDEHPFWKGVEVTRMNGWRLFERDGSCYGYNPRRNSWAHFPGHAERQASLAAGSNA